MGPIKDEDILFILPGSHTTLAQLGITETKSPPKFRFKTRMFPGEKEDEWEPYKVIPRQVARKIDTNPAPKEGGDTAMTDVAGIESTEVIETQYEEDRETDEGAVWPMIEGRVVHWPCFFALLTHVYNTLSPTLKSPFCVVAPPVWAHSDLERVCQFIMEKFKPPGLVFFDAATAAHWAFNIGDIGDGSGNGNGTGCVVDVGFDKCDITAIALREVVRIGRNISISKCAGRKMTENLLHELGSKGFTYDMCEELKHNSICEILSPLDPLPTEIDPTANINPAAASSTGLSAPPSKLVNSQQGLPRGPGPGTEAGEDKVEDDEGVLDVATIVASGKTSEILAKKEKEKAEKAAAKKAKTASAAESKANKLANSQKPKATFYYHESQPINVNGNSAGANRDAAGAPADQIESSKPTDEFHHAGQASMMVRKEVEVGVERFKADGEMHSLIWVIAHAVHDTISAAPAEHRSAMWENIMVVGNGSRIRGFKDALMVALNGIYLLSPANGTMFTSELPSDFNTPIPTGANTPNPQGPNTGVLGHHGAGVNPLLVAATHASNPSLAPPGQQQYQQFANGQNQARSGQGRYYQTPTTIKYAPFYEYLPEWKEHGSEEGAYFGALMHAHSAFQNDWQNPQSQSQEKYYMTRNQYNEEGPSAIHKFFY